MSCCCWCFGQRSHAGVSNHLYNKNKSTCRGDHWNWRQCQSCERWNSSFRAKILMLLGEDYWKSIKKWAWRVRTFFWGARSGWFWEERSQVGVERRLDKQGWIQLCVATIITKTFWDKNIFNQKNSRSKKFGQILVLLIMLPWTNVIRANIAWTNVTLT